MTSFAPSELRRLLSSSEPITGAVVSTTPTTASVATPAGLIVVNFVGLLNPGDRVRIVDGQLSRILPGAAVYQV